MTEAAVKRRRKPPQSAGKRLRGVAHAIGARRMLKALARRLGFDLVNRHFYSPIPDASAIPEAYWRRRSTLSGLHFDGEAQLEFLEAHLSRYLPEFSPPRSQPSGGDGFYLDNGTYGPVDAELLYAMVRHWRPARIVEVGSGFSSLVIGAALDANRRDGDPGTYEIIDPWPGSASYDMGGASALRRVGDLKLVSVTDVPIDTFTTLGPRDILFVDTTHTVKLGGDVNRIVLDILPRLAPGVIVHFHDVFLPWEYPRDWVERQEWYWAEQYLLQAFLAFNDAFEVLIAAHYLARDFGGRLSQTIPSAPGASPLALWLRRTR